MRIHRSSNMGLPLHERSVEKIIYSPAGQALLRATLSETNAITCNVVPILAREALLTLKECMQGKGDRTRLAAAEVTLNLILDLKKWRPSRSITR